MPDITRSLSDGFMNDLKKSVLYPLLERVQQDHTLMLAIRKNCINIYYRGGNILRVKAKSDGSYSAFFDEKYNQSINSPIPQLPNIIRNQKDSEKWVGALQNLKLIMDSYFSTVKSELEREFQQLIARENNFSSKKRKSGYGYYIADIEFNTGIEFEDKTLSARFDILAVQRLVKQRKFRPALIEMKYGDDSLNNDSGIIKHLEDLDKFIKNEKKYNALLETMESQFCQLKELGLMEEDSDRADIKITKDEKPEVICILANHNPRSPILRDQILKNQEIDRFANSLNYDLKFFVSSFAGFSLHPSCMFSLNEFKELGSKFFWRSTTGK